MSDETFYRGAHPWMTDGQWSAACLIADVFGGFHHLRQRHKGKTWWIFEAAGSNGVVYRDPGQRGMATFDACELTHLVVLAHERCIRVELSASMNSMMIMAHQRKGREGRFFERHPTIEDAIKALSPQRMEEDDGPA